MKIDISKATFSKSLEELEYGDIERYFEEEREETLSLECKSLGDNSIKSKIEEDVIRTVCAFLNSEGGVMIWGSPREKKNADGHKVVIGELTPTKEFQTKDWFINKLTTNIKPWPSGIEVKALEQDGCYVYIIEVQKSEYSPHQFKDKYRARLDGQTIVAPHYLVEALFRKIKYPNLSGTITFHKVRKTFSSIEEYVIDGHVLIQNNTASINEEEVYIGIRCKQGNIWIDNVEKENVHFEYKVVEILPKGLESIIPFSINIDSRKLKDSASTIKVGLVFGGKKSFGRRSEYLFDFDQIKTVGLDLNRLLTKKIENALLS